MLGASTRFFGVESLEGRKFSVPELALMLGLYLQGHTLPQPYPYSRSPKVGNKIASILKSHLNPKPGNPSSRSISLFWLKCAVLAHCGFPADRAKDFHCQLEC